MVYLNELFQVSDGGIREAVLTALKGVLTHAGKNVSSITRNRLCSLLRDLIQLDNDEVRISAGRVLGAASQVC